MDVFLFPVATTTQVTLRTNAAEVEDPPDPPPATTVFRGGSRSRGRRGGRR